MSPGPRLRTVQKARPPFNLNEFPPQFIDTFAREVVYMQATKEKMSLEGNEWEQIFANCVGAEWHPSNVGLDDVQLANCCWGAKTVYGNTDTAKTVRLISGRNSPTYSYGVDRITSADPDEIGELILEIWNERVSAVREVFKFVRTVVLMKSPDFSTFKIWEFNTVRYDPELYHFEWNKRGNLEGFDRHDVHRFTWQPSGSQFTIIEDVPEDALTIQIRKPPKLDKDELLNALKFNSRWYRVIQ